MTDLSGFEPGEGREMDLRSALGRFATGVTVVTAETPNGPIGMTVNSFSSLSLTPPLILWCAATNSERYPFFAAAEHFAVHVLGADQRDLAAGFARAGDDFGTLDMTVNQAGCPLINGCLARFECAREQVTQTGDHAIIVGRVTYVTARSGTPLIFSQGTFGGLMQ